ncbi:MAG: aspartyl/asparaginyl beta-hydroxylase domain-containing protein [Myxococcales bacterium]|nr:MAG: aspartyl/asparaginyl beta-hydroxylase domain-containing protein [Myxococcales bacterium]
MDTALKMAGIRSRRRHMVKRLGKRLFRAVNGYLARQSTIADVPVFDSALFDWSKGFAGGWKAIRKELDAMLEFRESLPRFQDLSPDQAKISPDDNWRTLVLFGFGDRSEPVCRLCPETARMLQTVPGLQTAFFSILAPGKHVPRHRGVTKGLVRCHLGLKIPDQAEKCRMDVGGVNCVWEEGKALFFDDTFHHEVWNETDQERAVLLFDFERPMTRRGRFATSVLLRLLRMSAYFKDAKRNQDAWEQEYAELLQS